MSLKKIVIFLVLFSSGSQNFILGQQPLLMEVDEISIEERSDYKKQANIVIVLDRGQQSKPEKPADTMQLTFQDCINQGVPVLVAGPILKNYLERINYMDEMLMEPIRRKLKVRLEYKIKFIGKSEVDELSEKIDKMTQNLKQYQIYALKNSDMYLLLPESINFKDAFNLNDESFIEETTIKDLQKLLNKNEWPNDGGNYGKDKWLDGMKGIFKQETKYWWNILLNGHGGPRDLKDPKRPGLIARLKKPDFMNFINFLSEKDKLNVFFFFYDTCYGGGPHFVTPYLKEGKVIKKSFEEREIREKELEYKKLPFTVVSKTTRGVVSFYIKMDYKRIFETLNYLLNPKIEQLKGDSWANLLDVIKSDVRDKDLTQNYPMIKFAGMTSFYPIRSDKRIKFITNVLVQKTKLEKDKEKKEIKVSGDVKTIFVYPNYIDIPIVIDGDVAPLIISINPGPNFHCFDEIQVKKIDDIYKVLDLFLDSEEKDKLFVVKKLIYDGDKKITDMIVLRDEIYYRDSDGKPKKHNKYMKDFWAKWKGYRWTKSDNVSYPGSMWHQDFIAMVLFNWYKDSIENYEFSEKEFEIWLEKTQEFLLRICDNFKIDEKYKVLLLLMTIQSYLPKTEENNLFYFVSSELKSVFLDNRFLFLKNRKITNEVFSKILKFILKINELMPVKALWLYNNPDLKYLPRSIKKLENLEFLSLPVSGTIILPKSFDRSDLKITGDYEFEKSEKKRKVIGGEKFQDGDGKKRNLNKKD